MSDKKCVFCGEKAEWDNFGSICNSCFHEMEYKNVINEHDKEIRVDEHNKVIDEVKMYAYRNIHFFDAIEQKGFYEYLEQLRGGVENGRD